MTFSSTFLTLSQTLKKEAILDACISDYCYCKDENRKECACNGLTVFAKECQFQGINLKPDWRDMELCRMFYFYVLLSTKQNNKLLFYTLKCLLMGERINLTIYFFSDKLWKWPDL